ncbi:DUF5683 domain-containing protein [Leptobacterium flavescens]|uniref:DUF5683 domain-containing protein n=1 Tax=Leptobacterium flavescens TaxID=472055 RepID=UPI001953D7A7|nr:DUF5683 domain-containing protein [Leptobacterium flavescens]
MIFFFFSLSVSAQKKERDTILVTDSLLLKSRYNPLSPSKAAFYSAVLPGLGQAYNKSYWKIPIVYGALGTGIFFYIDNSNEYNRFRDAFKRRLAGFQDDEFFDINGDMSGPDVSDQALQDAQETFQRNRELALIITVGLYVLNIIDANVDAHLKQFNIDDDLTFQPVIFRNPIDYRLSTGFSIKYKF